MNSSFDYCCQYCCYSCCTHRMSHFFVNKTTCGSSRSTENTIDNMVKGKRKCTGKKNVTKTGSSFMQKNNANSVFELNIKKLDTKNLTNRSVAVKPQAASEICKSATQISYSRKQGLKTDKAKDSSQSLDHYFFENRQTTQACGQEKNEIISDVEQFKTDETPVAVPIHGPSTPHRINMPQNDSEYPDEESLKKRESITVTLLTPVQVIKKPALPKYKKVASSQSNNHHSTKASNIESANHSITDYFPVRRSIRKSKKVVLEEKQRDLENKVLCQIEEGIEVKYFMGKGRGIISTRNFAKGEFVVEYIGELVNQGVAKGREKIYAQDQNTGCYMYYFQHRGQQYCVDATAETNKLGRLVNHSRNGNLITRIVEINSIPHLVLTAKEDIPMGVEITYDYGDRSRESIRHHPWLAL